MLKHRFTVFTQPRAPLGIGRAGGGDASVMRTILNPSVEYGPTSIAEGVTTNEAAHGWSIPNRTLYSSVTGFGEGTGIVASAAPNVPNNLRPTSKQRIPAFGPGFTPGQFC